MSIIASCPKCGRRLKEPPEPEPALPRRPSHERGHLGCGMALLWLGFAVYGLIEDISAVPIFVFALACGVHVGLLGSTGDCASSRQTRF